MSRRRGWRFAIGLSVGGLVFALAGTGLAQPPGFWPPVLSSTGSTVPIASGIQYSHYTVTTAAGPLHIHHIRADLDNPTVRVGVGLAHNRLVSPNETVSSMAIRNGAVAGVNADFFDIHATGMPLNIVVRDGELLRSPSRWVALASKKDGTAKIVRFKWAGTVALPETRETYSLDGYNTGLVSDGLLAVSDVWGGRVPMPEPGMRQAVVELTPASDLPVYIVKPGSVTPVTASPDRYFVKQVWQQQEYSGPFRKGEIFLVGRGSAADWVLAKMIIGGQVQVNLTTDPDWHDLSDAVGGGPQLVRDGRIVDDPDAPASRERDQRYPVVAVGIARDGRSLLVVEVDGRQPRFSIGLTQPQLAAYMQWLGASEAMAFDSGGSATVVARLPGRPHATVVNSPSDGSERPVADALLLYSRAVPGQAATLLVNANQPLRLFATAAAPLSVIGVDAQGNPVPALPPLTITAPPHLAFVTPTGIVQAGARPGTGVLHVQSGPATGTIPFSVVTQLTRLVVSPSAVSLAPGTGQTFILTGRDADGHPVVVPDGAATWRLTPPWLGTISGSGRFVAGDLAGTGTITVWLGGAASQCSVTIAKSHVTHRPVGPKRQMIDPRHPARH